MKIHIHQAYLEYKDFIHSIPTSPIREKDVFCKARNTVYKTNCGGKCFVVKKYKLPTWTNRLIYTFLRKSKAQRAFENAGVLIDKGIETAFPVAYMTTTKFGMFHTGYFVSEYLPYNSIEKEYINLTTKEERESFEKGFINFELHLHSSHILPKDNNPGNTLAHKEKDGWHFALIDINRMETNKIPNFRKSMRSFEQLGIDLKGIVKVLPQYSEKRGFKLEDCALYILQYRRWSNVISRFKSAIKSIFRRKQINCTYA